MKVKITSDGMPCGTKITTDQGDDLGRKVSAVYWSHQAGELPQIEMTLGLIEFEIEGEAAVVGPGSNRRIRRIEYEDGGVEEFSINPVPLNTGAHKEATPMDCRVRKTRVPSADG